jgi:3-hydroxyisobutyrate dehydrogenase
MSGSGQGGGPGGAGSAGEPAGVEPLAVEPGAVIGFVGLGNMGLPMTRRLTAAGYTVRAYDTVPEVRERARSEAGAVPVDTAAGVADGATAVILMLPNSRIVEAVLEEDGLLDALAPGGTVIDMSSSEPTVTRELAERFARAGKVMVDAPVSGGTSGARQGMLTVMAGGTEAAVRAVGPLLDELGKQVLHVGPPGAGHALKALNNLLSATHLLVTSEAVLAGESFGLDPQVMLEVINTSSGRSGSTDNKWPNFILNRAFNSGFGLRLMLKDMRIALGLTETVGHPSELGRAAVELWAQAADRLPADADHTEIVRWLEESNPQLGGPR